MAMKTNEKPKTNSSEFCRIGFRVFDCVSESSSTDIPVMNDKYDGNSGKTQGERNENVPPRNATKIES
jgi:hypothetical protein